MTDEHFVITNTWASLRAFTPARIGLGHTGHSVPTNELLKFQCDHALARDAVYSELDGSTLVNDLQQFQKPVLGLHSEAQNRQQYLQRPDLGRRLSSNSQKQVLQNTPSIAPDVAFVLADGLSATAISQHALPVLQILVAALENLKYIIAPFTIVEQGRVAVADEIGFLLKAKIVVILIGERPGLSSPDSMGAYLTYQPTVGLTDESRNCVSNIHLAGLSYPAAAAKLCYLIQAMTAKKLSGVNLKDEAVGRDTIAN